MAYAGNHYSVIGDQEAADDITILSLLSATTIRPSIYYVCFGVAGEAVVATDETTMQINRVTDGGTNTSITPALLVPDNIASKTTCGKNHTAEPTKTSGEVVLQFSHVPNQTTNFQWYAPVNAPGLVSPRTASNGMALVYIDTTNNINHICEFHFVE